MNDLLLPMFEDEYYPDVLVKHLKDLLLQFAEKINRDTLSETEVYYLAYDMVVQINKMKAQFEQLDSALDATAADYITEAMMMVVQEAGYMGIDMEELVANREW